MTLVEFYFFGCIIYNALGIHFFCDQMKFESHSKSYKHDIELTIPCNVNEACALLLFTKVQYTSKKTFSS